MDHSTWAEEILTQYSENRDQWLERAHSWLKRSDRVQAVWLVGSLGRQDADEWSDVDLIVVCERSLVAERHELRALGEVILEWDAPQNAPQDAMHYCTVFESGPLPLSVDWHLWPSARASKPIDARPLFERASFPKTNLTFQEMQKETSARNKSRTFPQVSEGDRRSGQLFMLGPICKDLVRGWSDSAAMMMEWIGGRRPEPTVDAWVESLQERLDSLSKGFPTRTVALYQTLLAVTAAKVREMGVR